jgi:DNA-binding NarL/FixJ family response regulator
VTRVVVADDQELVRDGIALILDRRDDIEVVGCAADGTEAVDLVRALQPDVLVLDIRMPRLDGIATIRALRAGGFEKLAILVLTTFDDDEVVFAALQAGATGFMLKDAPRDALVEGVRTVARGDALLAPTLTRRLIERYVGTAPDEHARRRVDSLSNREREVLRLIARGLSNRDIGARLYLAEPTVKTHVRSIFRKVAVTDRAQAIVVAYESGLVQVRTPE